MDRALILKLTQTRNSNLTAISSINFRSRKPKLLDLVKDNLRVRHYSRKTEESYVSWIKRFIFFNSKKNPNEMGKEEIQKFLNYLAVEKQVSSSTQNQALQAILYLYKNIIKKEIGWLEEIIKAHRSKRLPVVFTKSEVREIFINLSGVPKIICSLLYGSGLRLGEALELRVKDINFEYRQIIVREAKGDKDRITTLPDKIIPELKQHLNKVNKQHKEDLKTGRGITKLPYALSKKYPNANRDFYWQYAFPA